MSKHQWLKPTPNLEITIENDNGEKCEIVFLDSTKSWTQDGKLVDPCFLDKLQSLLLEHNMLGTREV